MMPVVRISEDVWGRLKEWAIPLEDKPDDVLRRLLDLADEHRNCQAGAKEVMGSEEIPKTKRLRKGEKVPQEAYSTPILEVLYEVGGRGPIDEILQQVESKVRHLLGEVDYQQLNSGEPRWRNTAMWERYQLVLKGFLKDDSPRGIWELTQEGTNSVESTL